MTHHLEITHDGRPEWQVRLEMERNVDAWRKRQKAMWRMRRLRAWREEQTWKHGDAA